MKISICSPKRQVSNKGQSREADIVLPLEGERCATAWEFLTRDISKCRKDVKGVGKELLKKIRRLELNDL